jgi:RNA polymerase sigma factor (sigma-70 family)
MTRPRKDPWLEGVVDRNDRDLKRYLSQRVGNRAEVEDLAQEIYLRLLRIERKDLIRSPEALLFRVASNAIYEWRLLARNRLPHSAAGLEGLESLEGEPSADIWRAELAHALSDALERLSPKCRAAVVLHRREQLTYSEVGVQLGISVGMVKKHLAHGIALCRGHLRERLGLGANSTDEAEG